MWTQLVHRDIAHRSSTQRTWENRYGDIAVVACIADLFASRRLSLPLTVPLSSPPSRRGRQRVPHVKNGAQVKAGMVGAGWRAAVVPVR